MEEEKTEEEKARYFVSDGISNGKSWGTYERKENGALRRVCSCALPLRCSKEEAEGDLLAWLKRKEREKRGRRINPFEEEVQKDVIKVLDYLNERSRSAFRQSSRQTEYITARLGEGYTVEDLKAVIDLKVRQWAEDPIMSPYLRPSTLFNREKCEAYHQEVKRNGDPKNPYRRGIHGEPEWESDPDQL